MQEVQTNTIRAAMTTTVPFFESGNGFLVACEDGISALRCANARMTNSRRSRWVRWIYYSGQLAPYLPLSCGTIGVTSTLIHAVTLLMGELQSKSSLASSERSKEAFIEVEV